jgi:creatinine amidohydrolase
MKKAVRIAFGFVVLGVLATDQSPAQTSPGQPPQTKGGQRRARVDMATMVRPIEMHDTVWIEDMTVLEIRDSIKAGKTTALVLVGGMEDNGPYITVGQHNSIVRALGDRIARRLGNALCAPVVAMAPGTPDRSSSPGSVVLSTETYASILVDIATSLRAQGFHNIMFMVDHGSDQKPAVEVTKSLNEKWKGEGAVAWYVSDYYNYDAVNKYSTEVLGNHEKSDGYHDDYYVAAISAVVDPVSARMPERIKAGKTTINGIDLAAPKATQDGNKIIEFRVDAAIKQIQKMTAESKAK